MLFVSQPSTHSQLCSWVQHQVSEGLGNSSAWVIVMFGLDQFMILELIMVLK